MPAETETNRNKQKQADGEREREREREIRSDAFRAMKSRWCKQLQFNWALVFLKQINKWNDEAFDDVCLINHHLTHTVDGVCRGLIVCVCRHTWKLTHCPDQWLFFESNLQTHVTFHYLITRTWTVCRSNSQRPSEEKHCGEVRSSNVLENVTFWLKIR